MNLQPKKLWNRQFILILGINFCHQMCQQMMNTLIPQYASSLGASAYAVGLVSSAFATTSFCVRPIASPAFDSFSKKRLLLVVLAGLLASFVGYSQSRSVAGILAVRLLHGACMGCIAPLSLAMAGDSLPDSKLGQGIGIFTLCQAVGQAVGPSLGLELSRAVGFSNTFLFGAAEIATGIVLAMLLREDSRPRQAYRITLNKIVEPDAIHPAVILMLQLFAYSCIASYLITYGTSMGIENIGLFFTVYALFLLVTRPLSGRLVDRYGYLPLLTLGMSGFALSFFIIGSSRTIVGMLAAAVVNAFGYGVCYPTMQSLVISCAPRSKRGAAASTSFIGADMGMLLGPSLMGLAIDKIIAVTGDQVAGYSWGFRLMTLPILLGLAYFLVTWKSIRGKIEKHSKETEVE